MALFSATMPGWVEKLQQKFLKDPVRVEIGTETSIEQIAYRVPQEQKMAALCTLLHSTEGESSLIFGKTKYGVEKLGKQLSKLGFTVGTLHGNKSQSAREAVLTAFRRGQVQTLLATNVAARGLDITGIDQVINYELPESSDLFTHRIGRTGRMGRQGKAITLLVPSDVPKWRRMTHNLGQGVVLQQLVIDEDALVAQPLAILEDARTQGREQEGERRQRPGRDREHVSTGQERSRRALPERESGAASGMKGRRKERITNEALARTRAHQSEDYSLPEGPSSGKPRDGRRGVGRQYRFGKTTKKHEARALAATASQYRSARRKPGAVEVAQGRRAASSRSGRR